MSKAKSTTAKPAATLTQWDRLVENLETVAEREMTDAEMKERERLVKGMKHSEADFKERYGDRWKKVMYGTATQMAKEKPKTKTEDAKPYPYECMKCGNKWRSTESGQVNPVRCPKCGASGEDDILPGVFSGPGSQSGGNLNKAPETFTVMAIDDTNPEYKRVGSNYKPNVKVLDQMHSLEKSDVMHAAKMFRQKHPKATISVENKGGKIVKVFKPGEMIKEADMPVMSAGARVMVPHKGKKVAGKVVRYDKGDMHGSPFYVVDVGEYASIKVPAHEIMREAVTTSATSGAMGKPATGTTAVRPNPQQQLAAADVIAKAIGGDGAAARITNPSQKVQTALRSYQSKPGRTPQTDKVAAKMVAGARDKGIDVPDSVIPPSVKSMLSTTVQENHDEDEMKIHVDFDDVSDHDDQEMMTAQLDAIRSRAAKLHSVLSHVHIDDIPAWIQDKVSIADHNMNAILDYFQYESSRLDEAEVAKTKELAWFLQPAHMVAKVLGGPGYAPVGVKAEDIVNNAILAFLRGSHTTEMWKAAGAALNAVRDVAGVQWDENLIKPSIQKAMGIKSAEAPAEPPAEAPAEKEAPAKEPAAKEAPKAEAEPPVEKTDKKDKKAEPETTTEEVEIEIKLGKPMDNVTFQQKRQAALDFAAATCPGMNPNGVTPEQIVNNAVSVWFHHHPVPLEAELEVLGNALETLSKLGIDWNFHLVPALYLKALKLPNVKVDEVGEKDTSAAGKKIDKLDDILIKL